eukprot:TRINITY_DN3080_c0_g1_i1.p1 TRINITY_DN3080_c0_g1~~TRINITY_DN3080_c0_g1_i1.p1  ORF type:complete len:156 (+),score=45.90 TRINITY_DN3080_c0_g1_i1:35-502(+)
MASLPADVEASLSSLERCVDEMEAMAAPFVEEDDAERREQLKPFEQAKLNILLSYSISSLFYAYLKTLGVPPQQHAVKKELDRVRAYMKKLKDHTTPAAPRTSRMDVGAAKRFIASGVDAGKAKELRKSGGGGGATRSISKRGNGTRAKGRKSRS